MTLQNYQKKDEAIRLAFETLKKEHPEQLKKRLKFSWSNWGFGLENFPAGVLKRPVFTTLSFMAIIMVRIWATIPEMFGR